MRSSSVTSSDSDNNKNQKSKSRSKSKPRTKVDQKPVQENGSFKVKIGQLVKNVSEVHLKEIFSIFGDILRVQMPASELKHLSSKRQVIIEYANKSSMEAAVEHMNGGELNGSPIIVSVYQGADTRERSREKEKAKKDDDPVKKDPTIVPAEGKDKKNSKGVDGGRKSTNMRDKDNVDKLSKKKFSGRFNRKDKKYRESSESSSESSKNDSSGTSRSSTSSLSGSSSGNSSD
jgi:RNA recognition motif-containing protein